MFKLLGFLHRLHDGSEIVETENHPVAESVQGKIAASKELYTQDPDAMDEYGPMIKSALKAFEPVLDRMDNAMLTQKKIAAALLPAYVMAKPSMPIGGLFDLAWSTAGGFLRYLERKNIAPSPAAEPEKKNGTAVQVDPVTTDSPTEIPAGNVTVSIVVDRKRYTESHSPAKTFGDVLEDIAKESTTAALAAENPDAFELQRGDGNAVMQLPDLDTPLRALASVLPGHIWGLNAKPKAA